MVRQKKIAPKIVQAEIKKVKIFAVIAVLVLVIIILIFVVLPSFKPKQAPNSTAINPGNQTDQICQKINQEDVKSLCLALVKRDEKYCQNLDNSSKNVCLAAVKKDNSFCQNVPKNNRQYCYQNLVNISGNSTFCDKLESPQEVSACYVHFVSTNYYISNLKVINKSMCDKVLQDQPEHQLCLAMATQSTTPCGPERIDCQALITKDLTLCSKSASKIDEGECYHNLAMLKQDSSVCERIESLETKDDCYRDYSRLSQDQIFCDKISNLNQKDQCLLNITLNVYNK
ncbi:hypothetical protein M1437_01025 [Patescibacteria group bacterium]|nr:hypothetical protein [Patescibacteria group bacterium]